MRSAMFLLTLITAAGAAGLQAGPPSATLIQNENPFVGSWRAKLSESQLSPSQTFQSATLQFDVGDDAVTITHRSVGPSGEVDEGTTTYQTDGEEHEAGPGATFATRWLDSRVLEVLLKVNGEQVGRVTYEVSHDRTLTVRTSGTDESGTDFESVVIHDRQ